MKVSVQRARVKLGTLALQALYAATDAADPIKLTELFEPDAESSEVDRAESRNRKWQRHMMDELKAAGIVQGDDEPGYSTVDRKQLSAILVNTDKDSRLLARLIFESASPDAPPAEVSADPDAAAATEIPEGTNALLVSLITMIETNHKSFRQLLDMLLVNSAKIYDQRSGAMNIDGPVAKIDERISRTNSRLDKLENRVGDVLRVTEAVQATLKSIAGSLADFGGASKAITDSAGGMTRAASALERVSEQISEAEQDKFGRLVRALKAHLDEGTSLHEAALELVAKVS